MPKVIHSKYYIHRQYSKLILPDHRLEFFLNRAKHIVGNFEWNTLRVAADYVQIAFQLSEDFDTADEPTVHQTVCVDLINDKIKITHTPNLIWHHKWQWVEPDYKGFDYHKAKARSELWKPFVKKEELSKIGNKDFWNSIRPRWEK